MLDALDKPLFEVVFNALVLAENPGPLSLHVAREIIFRNPPYDSVVRWLSAASKEQRRKPVPRPVDAASGKAEVTRSKHGPGRSIGVPSQSRPLDVVSSFGLQMPVTLLGELLKQIRFDGYRVFFALPSIELHVQR